MAAMETAINPPPREHIITGMIIGATWSMIITKPDIRQMIPIARKTVILFRIDSAPFMRGYYIDVRNKEHIVVYIEYNVRSIACQEIFLVNLKLVARVKY